MGMEHRHRVLIGFLRVRSVSRMLQQENTTKLLFPQYQSDISRGK